MTAALSPAELAMMFADIGEQLGVDAEDSGNRVLDDLVRIAVERVDGADYAGITVGRDKERFETPAATSDLVLKCDQIQYELRSGPCVDAALEQTVFNAADLRTDLRWPEFGRRCVEHTGIVSMLSMRFFVESDLGMIAGLNMYSHQPAAFDNNSEAIARLLATHGALAVAKASAEDKARNLLRALENSREIGMAMGILMADHKITRDQAFDLLRMASQHTHRKLADIATQVTETGALPDSFAEQQR
jgi:ANTAR domain-containing protein/GAF domain-containing protein